MGANNFSNELIQFKFELLETQNPLYGLCYTLNPNDYEFRPNTAIHFVVNYTESLDENDVPKKLRLFVLSKDIYRVSNSGSTQWCSKIGKKLQLVFTSKAKINRFFQMEHPRMSLQRV